jgi:hypothetical protein
MVLWDHPGDGGFVDDGRLGDRYSGPDINRVIVWLAIGLTGVVFLFDGVLIGGPGSGFKALAGMVACAVGGFNALNSWRAHLERLRLAVLDAPLVIDPIALAKDAAKREIMDDASVSPKVARSLFPIIDAAADEKSLAVAMVEIRGILGRLRKTT